MNDRPATHSPKDAAVAVGLMVLACALLAGTTLIAKMLGPAGGENPLHPFQISAGRFCFAALVLTPFLAAWRPSFAGTRWANHVLRVLFGWAGVSALFAASGLMRLADANAISFLNPVVAMLLSIPLLGEKVGPWRWGAAAVAFVGAMIIVQPGSAAFQPIALVALVAAMFMGAEAILIKKLADSEPPLRILAINNFAGAALAATAASFVWIAPTSVQWMLMATLGAAMISVQALFIQALRRGEASFVMPFFYLTLIFAAFYDYVLFAEVPALASWLGAALIIASAITIAWRERINRRTRDFMK
ncbi:DMT family transporter [Mesorhizobium sp. YIM 152430]|uniref:DMT family transporter n=1 Tax=Mesorhizobium sp. YIM 152430 TaxID=3031761 RepID=UPI0023D9B9A1|nr:DMT family transporter [Mesorhizobium sp. YIM 152430]MDF1599092.1 DMT family transporter [Mesorhizobium sp. YIM 152430]